MARSIGRCIISWADGVDRATGYLVTSPNWNDLLGASGSLMFLKTHAHGSGVTGDGSSSLGPLVLADFTTAAAPAAPGASKGRFYVVTGDRPGFRSGAAGAAEQLSTLTGTETHTNKTFTSPVVNTQLTGTAVGTGASQVAQGSHTTPAMTATVAGHVPTPPNNTTTFLRGDGTFAVPAGGLSRAGGNVTEATTTSTTAVDLLSVSSLSISATAPIMLVYRARKTSGAANGASTGLKLNATIVNNANAGAYRGWLASSTNQAEDGIVFSVLGARQTNYTRSGLYFMANDVSNTAIDMNATNDAAFPTATITDVVVRGVSGNAAITTAADECHVYSLAES